MSDLYELHIEERPEYLYVCVTAPYMTLQVAVDYSNELMSHLRSTGQKKVLFVRESPEMGSEAHYKIVANLIMNMLPQHITLAVVDRSASHKLVRRTIVSDRETKSRNINAFDTF